MDFLFSSKGVVPSCSIQPHEGVNQLKSKCGVDSFFDKTVRQKIRNIAAFSFKRISRLSLNERSYALKVMDTSRRQRLKECTFSRRVISSYFNYNDDWKISWFT